MASILSIRPGLSIALRCNNPGLDNAIVAHPSVIEQIVDWKMGAPHWLQGNRKLNGIERGAHMQRQFTMELRVDYADQDKNEVMRGAMRAAARHVFATAALLADNGVRPEIAVHSDDFFCGHEEIKLLEDTIAQGLEATSGVDEAPVSSELMSAVRDSASGS